MRRIVRRALIVVVALALPVFVLPHLRWRAELVVLKVAGRLPDVSWGELRRLLPPGSGIWLGELVDTRNPYISLTNPLTDSASVRRGEERFRSECAQCHGARAEGASGPNLATGVYRRGSSDWAMYRTITLGVPASPMQPHALAPDAVWQLIAYVRERALLASTDTGLVRGSAPMIDAIHVTYDDLLATGRDGANWLTYSGAYHGQRHSPLEEINRTTAGRLRLKWMFQLPKFVRYVESSPIVVGNTMFVTLPPNEVYALDARTGEQRWVYSAGDPASLRVTGNGGAVNRGVAVLGNAVFIGTADAHLVALDAQTGKVRWDVKVAENTEGYFITGAPLALKDRIILGTAGGEFGVRGRLDAYSPIDGKRLWRFYTVPAPGEPGSDTWNSKDSWKQGGAPTWLTGSYDPELDLIYWGVGNPSPDFQGDVRRGDNLFSNSVIAIEGATGRLRWHFQFTPHDERDWDSVQIPVLANAAWRGMPRKLLYWANRNGFYYVLDRTTGEFLTAKAFVKQTWLSRFEPSGRPVEDPVARPTRAGTLVYPSEVGATNWWSPSYEPSSNTFFVPTLDGPGLYFKSDVLWGTDGQFNASRAEAVPGHQAQTSIRALDAATGDLKWEYKFPRRERSYVMGGLLTTNGGLLFGGDQSGFLALDTETGSELWRFRLGTGIAAAPITFLSQGRQSVTLATARAILTFSLDGR